MAMHDSATDTMAHHSHYWSIWHLNSRPFSDWQFVLQICVCTSQNWGTKFVEHTPNCSTANRIAERERGINRTTFGISNSGHTRILLVNSPLSANLIPPFVNKLKNFRNTHCRIDSVEHFHHCNRLNRWQQLEAISMTRHLSKSTPCVWIPKFGAPRNREFNLGDRIVDVADRSEKWTFEILKKSRFQLNDSREFG